MQYQLPPVNLDAERSFPNKYRKGRKVLFILILIFFLAAISLIFAGGVNLANSYYYSWAGGRYYGIEAAGVCILIGGCFLFLNFILIIIYSNLTRKCNIEKVKYIENLYEKIIRQERFISEVVDLQDLIIRLKNKGIDTREMEHLVYEAKGALKQG
jgi:uncharacterized membrane protein